LNSTLRNATKGRVMLEPCCQFSKQSPCEMAAIFREANIVIGMHGAGEMFLLLLLRRSAVGICAQLLKRKEINIYITHLRTHAFVDSIIVLLVTIFLQLL
jgi:pyrimidine deaminase RibD-like protein